MAAAASQYVRFMSRALALARRASGRTFPNPMVGAVIVKNGRAIAEGFHRRAGQPHAEIEALRRANGGAHRATMYVTLEPCNHHGRTPPCCDAILRAGISHVVIGARDPNPITHGRGIARLRRHGVRVTMGVLERDARALNRPFEKMMRRKLPLVIAKVGQSLDGKIAAVGGDSRWVTSPAARRLAHQWRGRVDAILVGRETVRRDDPLLSARRVGARKDRPIKIIVDSRLRVPVSAVCFSRRSPAPTIVATTVRRVARCRALEQRGAEVLVVPARRGRVSLRALCRVLARRGIQSVLIEGGGEVLASALAERLVDRVVWFIAPTLIGGRMAPSSIGGTGIRRLTQAARVKDLRVTRVGPDLCIEGRVVYPRTR